MGDAGGARERGRGRPHHLRRCNPPCISLSCLPSPRCARRAASLCLGPGLGASYRVLRRSFWWGHCCGGRCGHPDPGVSGSTLCRSHHIQVLGLTRRRFGALVPAQKCLPHGLDLQAKTGKARGAVKAPPGEDAASRSVAAESNHLACGRPAPEGFMHRLALDLGPACLLAHLLCPSPDPVPWLPLLPTSPTPSAPLLPLTCCLHPLGWPGSLGDVAFWLGSLCVLLGGL